MNAAEHDALAHDLHVMATAVNQAADTIEELLGQLNTKMAEHGLAARPGPTLTLVQGGNDT